MAELGTFLKLLELNRRLDASFLAREREREVLLGCLNGAIDSLKQIVDGDLTAEEAKAEAELGLRVINTLAKGYTRSFLSPPDA